MKIIYGHSPGSFQNLKIAGDFSDWKPLSMVKNVQDGLWEYAIDANQLPPNTGKLHFKFIDDNGVWFTDEDYPKEVDEHSNENNVKILSAKEQDSDSNTQEGSPIKVDDEGPESPVPSLKAPSEEKPPKALSGRRPVEDKDESVGGPAVLVNHSDAEDEMQTAEGSERPETGGSALSGRENNPNQYKDVLARIIAFFTNLFRSWFG